LHNTETECARYEWGVTFDPLCLNHAHYTALELPQMADKQSSVPHTLTYTHPQSIHITSPQPPRTKGPPRLYTQTQQILRGIRDQGSCSSVLSVIDFPVTIPDFDSCYSHQLLCKLMLFLMHREQTSLIWTLSPVPLISGLERFR
jgi:hypothetical protein